ncbi:hypothetical protein [Desulfovibrio inopinatus]|uniref:hypothetical protein n=1 Tax=Desulfovibrio inopinatus TaxID=102109 RepID=UPI00054DF7B7|nr:hypothetical protein [Desulfovibrio inopinatus]
MSTISGVASGLVYNPKPVNTRPSEEASQAEQMKNIQKQHLEREVLSDPSKAGKLVQRAASPVYNANGNLIQTSGSL